MYCSSTSVAKKEHYFEMPFHWYQGNMRRNTGMWGDIEMGAVIDRTQEVLLVFHL